MKNKKGMVLASAVAALFASACSHQSTTVTPADADAGMTIVDCYGINSCKGHGSCQTAENGCKGANSCKGKGIMSTYKSECEAHHGRVTGAPTGEVALIACAGLNGCKGMAESKTAEASCKGKTSCKTAENACKAEHAKDKGILHATAAECVANGGTVQK